jgi:2'-5' RNA ligase
MMKKSMQTVPGKKVHGTPRDVYDDYTSQLRLCEYMLVLSPHEELRNRIIQVRKEFSDTYQAPMALGAKPHLALARFTQLEMLEERIVNRLKTVGMGYPTFKVELKDFGSYPSHTLFINVITKGPIQNLVREVKESQRLMKLDNEHKPHFIDEPQMTIARKLLPWQYEKGWLEYSHRHFTGRFIADSMLLLKRRAGDKAYQIAQRFEFMNLPVSTKQGELFV